jgi:EAL domain-containing protein (putative c-di-GMP-specific phosphodiesterase class I)
MARRINPGGQPVTLAAGAARLPHAVSRCDRAIGLSAAPTGLRDHRVTPLTNVDLACVIATNLRASGIRLALDNFGIGHANLHYLQVLPLDQLKFDVHPVQSAAVESRSEKIVIATIGLGRSLGMIMIAEGIEQKGQATLLSSLGRDIGQGWLFGRPMPGDKIEVTHRSRRHAPIQDQAST